MKNSKQQKQDRIEKSKRRDESPDDRQSAREMQYRYGRSDKSLRKQALCMKAGELGRQVRRYLGDLKKGRTPAVA